MSPYDSPEKCYADLMLARKTFENRHTTEKQYDAMQRALGMIFLHCPEKVRTLAESTLNEFMRRRVYFELGPWLTAECARIVVKHQA